jgi:membrane associated rhomboid family serine protease
MLGQYWRFVTSIFGHHDLLHLTLNLASLVIVGDLVERIFDKKKMMLIYFVAGVASMALSHVWYTIITDHVTVVSAGASGAVCGLIGAALFGARKLGPQGAEVARSMKRWAIYMVIWGFVAPGINNAAHFGGFAVGALLARLTPVGITKDVQSQKVLSVAMLAMLAVALGCAGMMVENLRGFPVVLEDDAHPRAILGHVYYQGHKEDYSSQKNIEQSCSDAVTNPASRLDDAIHKCELNIRVNPQESDNYVLLAYLLERRSEPERADRVRRTGERIRQALGAR